MEENFALAKSDIERKTHIVNMAKAISNSNIEVLDGGVSGSPHSHPRYEINVQ